MSWRGMLRKAGIESDGVNVQILGSLSAYNHIANPGSVFYVKPSSGLDTRSALTPALAKKTVLDALTNKVTANKNDILALISESNTSGSTTDYQSATLDWSKDLSHLIGINNGPMFSHRSRIALISTYVTASNLMTVSAKACLFKDLALFAGVADVNPTGCLKVTGDRNVFEKCHIAGIGNDANDIADAYSLYISGQENFFNRCVIGLDTIDRGSAANSEIYFAAGALRNYFKNCIILMRLQHATNSPFVRVAGGAMGNPGPIAIFDNCLFIHCSTNYVYAQDYAFVFTAAPTAGIMVVRNSFTTASAWGAAGNHLIVHNSVSNTGYNQGLGYSA
jgi:hypothetical protein